MAFSPHSLTPAELASLLDAERAGKAFLAYRDSAGDLRLQLLDEGETVSIGRGEDNDLALDWDAEVSRTHAQPRAASAASGCWWTTASPATARS